MKKNFVLSIVLMMCVGTTVLAQSFDTLWKQYRGFADKDQPKSALSVLQKIKDKAEREKSYGNMLAALLIEVNRQEEISTDSGKVFRTRLDQRMAACDDGVMKTLYRLAKGDRVDVDSLLKSPDSLTYRRKDVSLQWLPFLKKGKDSRIFNNDLLHVFLLYKYPDKKLDSIYGRDNEYVRYLRIHKEQTETEPVLHAVVEEKVSTAKDIKIYLDRVRNLKALECTIHRVGTRDKRLITKVFPQHSEKEYFKDTLDVGPLQEGRWVVTLRDSEKKIAPVYDTITVSDTRLLQLSLPNNKKRYVYVNAITGEETTPDTTLIDRHSWNRYTYSSNKGYRQYTDIYTDRAIYRPGQKIEAAIIRSSVTNGIETSVVAGEKMLIRLLDSKGEKKAEKYAVTDAFGTAAVDFTLPEGDVRSGMWQLQTTGASASFRVEEYKRPTFEVKLKKNKDEYAYGDTAVVSGTAKTYNGIPLQNCRIIAGYYDKKDTLFTDYEGKFEIQVAIKDPFAQSSGRKIFYPWWRHVRVTAEVSDAKGEMQSAECRLFVRHTHQPEIPEEPKTETKKDTTLYHIYYTVFSGNKVLESSKIYTDTASFANAYTYKPEYGDGAMICYAWCKDDVIQFAEKVIRRPLPSNKLKIEWGTFRDKVAPGSKEVWTLKISPTFNSQPSALSPQPSANSQWPTAKSPQPSSQLLAVLYDASLDGIKKHSWNTHDRRHLAIPSSSWITPYIGHVFMHGNAKDWVKWRNFEFTRINSDCMIDPRYGIFYCVESSPRLMLAERVSNSKAMRLGSLSVNGAPEAGAMMKTSEVADMADEEMPLRTNFGETAFFYPKVETNSEGVAELSFTLPESLTSWRFMGLAHDKEMRVGTIDTMVIAQKQLMVQPNMPRFLRTGDKATISANVINTSDHDMKVTVTMTLSPQPSALSPQPSALRPQPSALSPQPSALRPQPSALSPQTSVLKAGETWNVTFPLTVGKDTTTLVCKIVAKSDDFTDGEQHEIPILPVVRTTPSLRGEGRGGASPKEIILEALPSLSVPSSTNAITLSNALYANVLTAALRDTLVSPANDNVLVQLLNLQNSDGSFSWYPGMRGSKYITMAVLKTLTRLKALSHHTSALSPLPLSTLKAKAFDFMQRSMEQEVADMKKYKTTYLSNTALDWLYTLAIDGEAKGHKSAAYKYLLSLVEDDTNKADMATKAVAAIVMENSRKRDEARTFVESIKQHTVYREDMGRYFDSYRTHYSWCDYRIPSHTMAIEALSAITPEDNCTIVEMQRWLVSSKRTQRWDNPVNTVNAVSAFRLPVAPCPEETEKMYHQPTPEELKDIIKVEREIITRAHSPQPSAFSPQPSALVHFSLFTFNSKVTVRITITADRDYDFVSVIDHRPACLEPVNQLSGYRWGYYSQIKDDRTEYFFDQLSKGTHVIETEYYVTRSGDYSTGPVTAVCTYAPDYQGSSPAITITCTP